MKVRILFETEMELPDRMFELDSSHCVGCSEYKLKDQYLDLLGSLEDYGAVCCIEEADTGLVIAES